MSNPSSISLKTEQFKDTSLSQSLINSDIQNILESFEPIRHRDILAKLLDQVTKIDFRELAELDDEIEKLSKKHFLVCIEEVLRLAQINSWGICKKPWILFIYIMGPIGACLTKMKFKPLGEAAEKMGIED
ncbi:MAG: hypothetical protein IPP93_00655 [Chitinophagaceae bacterium]|nr:hypothetical protein [Chitinophagaceae bacterium]